MKVNFYIYKNGVKKCIVNHQLRTAKPIWLIFFTVAYNCQKIFTKKNFGKNLRKSLGIRKLILYGILSAVVWLLEQLV